MISLIVFGVCATMTLVSFGIYVYIMLNDFDAKKCEFMRWTMVNWFLVTILSLFWVANAR